MKYRAILSLLVISPLFLQAEEQEPTCHSPYHMMHVGVRHTEARGVGYENGYTTIEGFGIWDRCSSFMPFLDVRGHVFNDSKLAGNIGIGERTLFSSINHIMGLYLYYDVRRDRHHLTVNQLSPGIELLGKRMEYRVNGYFPVGKTKSHKYHFEFDEFEKHRIMLKGKQRQAKTGFDAEVGTHITQSTTYDLYAGNAAYYFTSSHGTSWGYKARLLGRYKEYISLEASYTYDNLFRSIVQGTVSFNYPFGGKIKKRNRDCSGRMDLLMARAAFAPYRFEIPVVKRQKVRKKAVNPATGKPWTVWFVDNTSRSLGTFESPFPTLVQAQNSSGPNDMIYVFPGDGTTTGMNAGITLQNGQKFFGSGISQSIRTTNGRMTIPPFSSTSPSITNASGTGNVVNLASSNEVSGFNISVVTGTINQLGPYAIGNVVTPVVNISIHNNAISGTMDYHGVLIATGTAGNVATGLASGDVDVLNNQFTGLIGATTGRGVKILFADNTTTTGNVNDNSTVGFNRGIEFGANGNGDFNAQINNNFVKSFTLEGIEEISNTSATSICTIAGNTVINDTGSSGSIGIFPAANTVVDAGTVIVDNNVVITTTTATNTQGINFQIDNTMNIPTMFIGIIKNNTVTTGTGAGSTGIDLSTTTNGALCAQLINNTATSPTGTNSFKFHTSGGKVNITVLQNNVGDNISVSGNVNFVAPKSCGQ